MGHISNVLVHSQTHFRHPFSTSSASGSYPIKPSISAELEELIVGLANENPRWGYGKIQGELLKLGYDLSISSVRNVLKQNRITPTSERSSVSWRSFLGHYKDQVWLAIFSP